MFKRSLMVVAVLAFALAAVGCRAETIPGSFLRYEKATDGNTYAIVAIEHEAADGDEVRAYCDRTDLETGDSVRLRYDGRSWDVPQTKPQYEVVR